MLRVTTASTFSTSQLPKVVRAWCVLYLLTCKCASRHNGVHFFNSSTSKSGLRPWIFDTFDLEMCFAVQFFISHLASWLRTRRFSEVTFRPSRAPHLHLLASFSFYSLIFSILDFSSLTLPTSAFPSLHIVGSLTSKLPSANPYEALLRRKHQKIIGPNNPTC